LRRQAWTYGEGLGKIHLRYPEIGHLDLARRFELAWVCGVRASKAIVLSLAARLGLTTPTLAEFARYHWFWSRWFWRGYFSMLDHKEWRAL
jgi:hypothetical protein